MPVVRSDPDQSRGFLALLAAQSWQALTAPQGRTSSLRCGRLRDRLDAHREFLPEADAARLRAAYSRTGSPAPGGAGAGGSGVRGNGFRWPGMFSPWAGRPLRGATAGRLPPLTALRSRERPSSRRSERSWAMHSGAVCAGSNPAGGADQLPSANGRRPGQRQEAGRHSVQLSPARSCCCGRPVLRAGAPGRVTTALSSPEEEGTHPGAGWNGSWQRAETHGPDGEIPGDIAQAGDDRRRLADAG